MCRPSLPDYSVEFLPSNPWIHQPFEGYDSLGTLIDCWRSGKFELGGGNLCYDRGLRCTEGMFLGAAGLVEEVLEFVDCGVKTVVQSKASLIAVVVLKGRGCKKERSKSLTDLQNLC